MTATAFRQHPEVSYIYSNLLQVNDDLEVDYVFTHFAFDTVLPSGLPSLERNCVPGT